MGVQGDHTLITDFSKGSVWIVGAGPGDSELLTRKAERPLQQAKIVFYDALVGSGVLDMLSERAERVSVDKRSGRHSKGQDSINDLLYAAARRGKRVVRLKGGYPSIFGRSAEEIERLARGGVSVRICPGITAASAAAANECPSLTLRGLARGPTLVTAHARYAEALNLDWVALSASGATLGVYMGRAAAGEVARGLIAAGKSPDTPVMVAVNISLPGERLIRGRLSALSFLVQTISDDDPTLLLIGEAVDEVATAPAVKEAAMLC